ncbi:GntR family transcriptional regulator [Bacillus mojavensis]|jgi:DNA-binding GntR family transcriptional regulator|uniref:GntR family transcriptional regulator n=1 Tax=Bacillus mojavensis TaxID=72360 RepID=UPI002DBF619A|nr:GntR family transcriptional regulator [Bacillus mojavensis]MEC1737002.1 GntR family transcriptional regulator [Bacillus mojavensis]MEC1795592.1 GntR family transcriptional regulator [Bacillus mojavensis]
MPIPSNAPKPKRQTAKKLAFEQIQKWIVEGVLMPGEKLNDDALAKALGVSRTPVREALQLLEMQGFVEMSPGKETRISQIEKKMSSKSIRRWRLSSPPLPNWQWKIFNRLI